MAVIGEAEIEGERRQIMLTTLDSLERGLDANGGPVRVDGRPRCAAKSPGEFPTGKSGAAPKFRQRCPLSEPGQDLEPDSMDDREIGRPQGSLGRMPANGSASGHCIDEREGELRTGERVCVTAREGNCQPTGRELYGAGSGLAPGIRCVRLGPSRPEPDDDGSVGAANGMRDPVWLARPEDQRSARIADGRCRSGR